MTSGGRGFSLALQLPFFTLPCARTHEKGSSNMTSGFSLAPKLLENNFILTMNRLLSNPTQKFKHIFATKISSLPEFWFYIILSFLKPIKKVSKIIQKYFLRIPLLIF